MIQGATPSDDNSIWDDLFMPDAEDATRVLRYDEPTRPLKRSPQEEVTQSFTATAPFPAVPLDTEDDEYFIEADSVASAGSGRESQSQLLPNLPSSAGRERPLVTGVSNLRLFPAFLGFLTASSAVFAVLWLQESILRVARFETYTNLSVAIQQGFAGGADAHNAWAWAAVTLVGWLLGFGVGGYTASRLLAFSSIRQGLGTWLWFVLTVALSTILVLFFPNPDELSLPFAIQGFASSSFSHNFLAIVALAATTFVGSLAGAFWGSQYHKKAKKKPYF